MDITTPTYSEDRLTDLQDVMRSRFDQLVVDAVSSGWTRTEALMTLVDLTDNAILAEIADRATELATRQVAENKRAGIKPN